MIVLSLFDGISCGRVALRQAGVKVSAYYASEIEQGAIKIATANNPDITEIGDVCRVEYDPQSGLLKTENGSFDAGKIDLLIGGSPCTDFSSIGYAKGMKSGEVEIKSLRQYLNLKENGVKFEGQSYLFWEFMRLLKIVKPKYFLLENVVMAKKWQAVVDEAIGVKPIKINSSLLSAQNRPRLYWTNIPNVSEPNDAGITLEKILANDAPTNDVSDCKTVQIQIPKLVKKYGYIPRAFNAYNASEIKDKACALSRGSMVTSSCATLLFVSDKNGAHEIKGGLMDGKYPVSVELKDGRYNIRRLSIKEMERLQTLPDDYTNIEGVGVQKRSAAIGNGWTVSVITHILSNVKRGERGY